VRKEFLVSRTDAEPTEKTGVCIAHKAFCIPVLSWGKGWLVVDKPAGISVHNDPGADLLTICYDFVLQSPWLREAMAIETAYGLHPVHRLDRDTSGLELLAGRVDTFRFFSRQFETRQVVKRYLAILHGCLPEAESLAPWQLWDWPLSADAGGRQHPSGKGPTVSCLTRYRVLEQTDHYSLVECDLQTGRKHQIRRHAKLAGHPVVGDKRYGSARSLAFLKNRCGFDRLGLHAHRLKIADPQKGPIRLDSPLPPAFEKLLADG
jgi:RluA family pseudouridine synthase